MKNKKLSLIYIAACFILCAIPFVCMTFARTDVTTENKRLAEMPALTQEGKFNYNFLPELGAYFDDHFAFRQQLVTADAEIQSKVFGVSNVDTVVKGDNGWLYYTATLDDYLGKTLSDRAIFNIAHNVALMQEYVETCGAKFLFTIAPNKSTLYGENMPYYDQALVSDTRNYQLLTPALEEAGISYLDLYQLFGDSTGVRYLKRDSHWDNEGARMVYNAMLDALEKEHDDFAITPALRTKTEIGDLNRMLYPLSAQPEWNVYYELPENYEYVTDFNSVEDAWIGTARKEDASDDGSSAEPKDNDGTASDTLLMYRDSFGNTLIPFVAEAFDACYFSKLVPYALDADMNNTSPAYVIVEKVERNLADFAHDPPVIPVLRGKLPSKAKKGEMTASIIFSESETNMEYMVVEGQVPQEAMEPEGNIYLRIKTTDGWKTCKPFYKSSEETDYGFMAYLPKDLLGEGKITVRVVMENGGTCEIIGEEEFTL